MYLTQNEMVYFRGCTHLLREYLPLNGENSFNFLKNGWSCLEPNRLALNFPLSD
jgi:hypothetical protein